LAATSFYSGSKAFAAKASSQGSALSVGNFDGCHLGHQKLFLDVKSYAAEKGLASAALSFEPAPRDFFAGSEKPSSRLFTKAQKLRALAELALDAAIIENFNAELAATDHETFYEQLLVQNLRMKSLTIGENFKFGKARRGDIDFLARKTAQDKIRLKVQAPEVFSGEIVSSSRIRQALDAGELIQANAMLGRPYMLEGSSVKGAQMGRVLGFPTLNLGGIQQLLPKNGVYFGYVFLGQSAGVMTVPKAAVPSVINLGVRPTMKESTPKVTVEAHMLAGTYPENGMYELACAFYFAERLRDEKKFANLDELKNAIQNDINRAKKILSGRA
jgi:riboflavin kinase / FMN adenylyltransferase